MPTSETLPAPDSSTGGPEPVLLTEPAEGVPPVTQTPEALAEVAHAFAATAGPVAVDAERASGFRYGQSAFLVQLRRPGAGTALLDPVAVPDLTGVAAAINDAEWVLHAADQDLPCLRELGLIPAALFDTELAARLLGRERVGLGAVVAETLGYGLAKEHSAADWSTRPLPESWLRYAALDVELLLPLREALTAELALAGKLSWARQEFEHVRTAPPPVPRTDPWRRTAGIQTVRTPRGLAVVRELWYARDDLARRLDRAPGRVLPAAAIVAAAASVPRTAAELVRLKEFSGKGTRRRAAYWQEAVDRARALPDAELPPRRAPRPAGELPAPRSWPDHHPEAAARLDAVRARVREVATRVDVPQENLLAPAAQRHLAWDVSPRPSLHQVTDRLQDLGARPWQVELTAGELTDALRSEG